MQRWNEETGRLEPFSPGERKYPPLSLELAAQLDSISITTHAGVTYRPCRVSLLDGKCLDCVFLVDAQEYIKVWGMWPDQDEDKGEVLIGDVVRIEPSPYCLPARFAQRLYDAGESGMGYIQFEIVYRWGSRSSHISGNAVDFVTLAPGKKIEDVTRVKPHSGRNAKRQFPAPKYSWCLYRSK